jgi:phage-related protein
MARLIKPGFTFGWSTASAMTVELWNTPTLPKPGMAGKAQLIPGRHGDLWVDDETYLPIDITLDCRLKDKSLQSKVAGWLNGIGDLRFDMYPDMYYKTRVVQGFDFAPGTHNMGMFFTVRLQAQPFRYFYPVVTQTVPQLGLIAPPAGGMTPGLSSDPIIRVNGNGNINLVFSDQSEGTQETFVLRGITDHIIIDSENKIAYKEQGYGQPYLLQNHLLQNDLGDWPSLAGNYPGTNLAWTGSASSIEVTPNWRRL